MIRIHGADLATLVWPTTRVFYESVSVKGVILCWKRMWNWAIDNVLTFMLYVSEFSLIHKRVSCIAIMHILLLMCIWYLKENCGLANWTHTTNNINTSNVTLFRFWLGHNKFVNRYKIFRSHTDTTIYSGRRSKMLIYEYWYGWLKKPQHVSICFIWLTFTLLMFTYVVLVCLLSEESCGGTYTESAGTITSPNYPESYSAFGTCSWTIRGPVGSHMHIKFPAFRLASGLLVNDYVEVCFT